MTSPALLASIVLPVHADPRARRLLSALAAQTAPRGSYEVIVIENGSADLADKANRRQNVLPV